jgi:DNA-binding protein H-NS
MSINLEKMSLPELIKLQGDLVPAIKQRQKKAKNDLRKQMENIAKQSGFTFDEIASSSKTTRIMTKVKPKYANPQDSEQTWTGRGRKPKWVESELASGKELGDLLI